MSEWIEHLGPLAPYLIVIAPGLVAGWTVVQMAKAVRRDRDKPKLSNTTHRLISMAAAILGSLGAAGITELDDRVVISLALTTGLACPTFWGLAIRLTGGAEKPWIRKVHWFMRGNRRRRGGIIEPGEGHRSTDPSDTWG